MLSVNIAAPESTTQALKSKQRRLGALEDRTAASKRFAAEKE